MTDNARLTDVIERCIRGALSHAHTCLPGKVVSFNPVTNLASVQPVIKADWTDSYGEVSYDTLPVIPNVPVAWPRGAGKVVRMPLATDDHVWLVFNEASIAEWRLTGQLSAPADTRRQSLGYPFALPGCAPDTSPLSAADAVEVAAGALIVGEDGGNQILVGGTVPGIRMGKAAVSPVALAPPVISALGAINTYIAALTAALAANATYTLFQTAMVAPGATVATALAAVSTTVPSTLTKSE